MSRGSIVYDGWDVLYACVIVIRALILGILCVWFSWRCSSMTSSAAIVMRFNEGKGRQDEESKSDAGGAGDDGSQARDAHRRCRRNGRNSVRS